MDRVAFAACGRSRGAVRIRRPNGYTRFVNFSLAAVLGLAFGSIAGVAAYVIAYAEYKRNWSFRGNAVTQSLKSAVTAFVFFFLAALVLAFIFERVRPA